MPGITTETESVRYNASYTNAQIRRPFYQQSGEADAATVFGKIHRLNHRDMIHRQVVHPSFTVNLK
jgi:hypothetical protein